MSYIKNEQVLSQAGLTDHAFDCVVYSLLGARQLLLHHRSARLEVVRKEHDNTLQTKADRESEKIIRAAIEAKHPRDRVVAEEFGITGGEEGNQWVIDPLDGTGIYALGLKASVPAVMVENAYGPLAAAICDPFQRELTVAQPGRVLQFALEEGMAIDGRFRAEEIHIPRPRDKKMAIHTDTTLRKTTSGPFTKFLSNLPSTLDMDVTHLSTGSNINNQRLASTRGHAWLTHAIGGQWDVRIGGFVTEQAGGVATNKNGQPITPDTQDLAIGSCDPGLHAILLGLIQEAYVGYQNFREG